MKTREYLFYAIQTSIYLLLALCIAAAFVGAEKAGAFFTSPPLACFWIFFAFLLAAGLFFIKKPLKRPALLLAHVGPVLIIAGALWGSKAMHDLRARLLDDTKIHSGRMQIHQGRRDNRVFVNAVKFQTLDFELALNDFIIRYYEPGTLGVLLPGNTYLDFPAQTGVPYTLPNGLTLKILRRFENFRVDVNADPKIFDEPGTGINYALEVEITGPDGQRDTLFVFKPELANPHPRYNFKMVFSRQVREYVSDLDIVHNDIARGPFLIKVNDPLHYGGYHFYQSSYDDRLGRYTVLTVKSDSGLLVISLGLIVMTAAVFRHFWWVRIKALIKQPSGESTP